MATPTRLEVSSAGTHPRKALKIYQDDVKTDYTSHWDWDYLPRDEVARLAATRPYQGPVRANAISEPQVSSRPFLFGAMGAAAVAVVSGLLLLTA